MITLLTPIDLISFREILKILIIKYNFFKQSKIIVGKYEIDSNQKIIFKNNIKAKLTEKELQLILALNKKKGIEKSLLLKKLVNESTISIEIYCGETSRR